MTTDAYHRNLESRAVLAAFRPGEARTARNVSEELDGNSLGAAAWVKNAIRRLVRSGLLVQLGEKSDSGCNFYRLP